MDGSPDRFAGVGMRGVREPWIPCFLIPEVSMTALDGESMKQDV